MGELFNRWSKMLLRKTRKTKCQTRLANAKTLQEKGPIVMDDDKQTTEEKPPTDFQVMKHNVLTEARRGNVEEAFSIMFTYIEEKSEREGEHE